MTMKLRLPALALMFVLMTFSSCGIYKARLAANSKPLTVPEMTQPYRPAGTLVETFHSCSVPGPTQRRLLIYLPEGYYDSDARYPVAYFNHGARGNETSWITKGRALELADSLFTCGKARPCILVFTNLNQYKDDADYGYSRRKGAIESVVEVDGRAESAFMEDIVAHVDSLFRTIPDKEHRSIAGMSLGGLQSMYISARHPESFSYVGMFSPLHKVPAKHGRYSWFYGGHRDNLKEQFSNPPLVYDIETGRSDVLYPGIRSYCRYLDRQGYGFTFTDYPGGHDWDVWSKAFVNYLQMIFPED